MERHFEEALKELKEKLLQMSTLVEEAIQKAVKAFQDRNKQLAEEVITNDHKIDMLEIGVENLAIKLLALVQPLGGDLRFITSVLKINNDLERLGDLAVNIAERTKDLLKATPFTEVAHIMKMAQLAQGMLRDSMDAFVNRNAPLAQKVCEQDDLVDQHNRQIFQELLSRMQQDPKMIERAIDLILVSKNLEKIADHATNICEEVIYIVEGRVIKHHIADQR